MNVYLVSFKNAFYIYYYSIVSDLIFILIC